jgi:CheY-like chemotaxis protein
MSNIVAVEDDAGTRMLIAALLKRDGHTVFEAADGQAALALISEKRPDLVVSDVEMPLMTGLELVGNMRADPDLAEIPVILLTSLDGRSAMRAGMVGGADDYLTKPFRPTELRDAVLAQLQRVATRQTLQYMATEQALNEQRLKLDEMYSQQYSSQFAARIAVPDDRKDERFANATLMAIQIANYAELAVRLSNAELTDLVRSFYARASDSLNLFSPHHVEFDGAGMVALFAAKDDSDTVSHALRAAKSALGVVDAADAMQRRVLAGFDGRVKSGFVVSVGLDSGPISLTRVNDALGSGRAHTLLVGETLSTVRALSASAFDASSRIVATVQTLSGLSGAVRVTNRSMVTVPGRTQRVDAGEIEALLV